MYSIKLYFQFGELLRGQGGGGQIKGGGGGKWYAERNDGRRKVIGKG